MKPKKLVNPNQIKVTLGLTWYAFLATLRTPASFAFSLIFPLVFVLVFGAFGNSSTQIQIGIPDNLSHSNPVYQTLEHIASQKDAPIALTTGSEADLEKQLSKGDLHSIVAPGPINDPTQTVTLITSNASQQGAAMTTSFLNGVLSQMNLKAAGVTTPAFSYGTSEISGRELRYIDYVLPGQIGFSLISIATFGIAFPFITLRKTLVLKRMFATTVKPISFVVSQCLSRSVQAVLQAVVILGVGILAFHFQLAHGWISAVEMIILAILGVLSFVGFGILISNLAKDEQSLPIALNLFNLPQMLLSGVFFPTDSMPHWVQVIGNNLPLSYLNMAMRKVATDGQSLFSVWPYIVGMIAWATVAYILAAKTFVTE